jgi:transcription initiation factor IIE alpha subunit
MIQSKQKNLFELIEQMEKGSICPTCKRSLEDVDHTEEINQLKNELDIKEKEI